MMDVEQLHVVLQQSFSPDAALRHPAEETIRNLKNIPGSVQLLLQVVAEKQVSVLMDDASDLDWQSRIVVFPLLTIAL